MTISMLCGGSLRSACPLKRCASPLPISLTSVGISKTSTRSSQKLAHPVSEQANKHRSEQMSLKNIEDFYPLSSLQEGLLFHGLYAPEESLYVKQLGYKIRDLDVLAVKRAWQKIIDRHPVFRTAFLWENVAKPLQV